MPDSGTLMVFRLLILLRAPFCVHVRDGSSARISVPTTSEVLIVFQVTA